MNYTEHLDHSVLFCNLCYVLLVSLSIVCYWCTNPIDVVVTTLCAIYNVLLAVVVSDWFVRWEHFVTGSCYQVCEWYHQGSYPRANSGWKLSSLMLRFHLLAWFASHLAGFLYVTYVRFFPEKLCILFSFYTGIVSWIRQNFYQGGVYHSIWHELPHFLNSWK